VFFARLLFLLFVLPFLDLVVSLWIAGHVPWDWIFLWIFGTAVLGIYILQRRIRLYPLDEDNPPTWLMVRDRLSLLVAGVLLILPGVLGDLCGLVLLIPWSRRLLLRWGMNHMAKDFNYLHVQSGNNPFGFDQFGNDKFHHQDSAARESKPRVIDVEVISPRSPD